MGHVVYTPAATDAFGTLFEAALRGGGPRSKRSAAPRMPADTAAESVARSYLLAQAAQCTSEARTRLQEYTVNPSLLGYDGLLLKFTSKRLIEVTPDMYKQRQSFQRLVRMLQVCRHVEDSLRVRSLAPGSVAHVDYALAILRLSIRDLQVVDAMVTTNPAIEATRWNAGLEEHFDTLVALLCDYAPYYATHVAHARKAVQTAFTSTVDPQPFLTPSAEEAARLKRGEIEEADEESEDFFATPEPSPRVDRYIGALLTPALSPALASRAQPSFAELTAFHTRVNTDLFDGRYGPVMRTVARRAVGGIDIRLTEDELTRERPEQDIAPRLPEALPTSPAPRMVPRAPPAVPAPDRRRQISDVLSATQRKLAADAEEARARDDKLAIQVQEEAVRARNAERDQQAAAKIVNDTQQKQEDLQNRQSTLEKALTWVTSTAASLIIPAAKPEDIASLEDDLETAKEQLEIITATLKTAKEEQMEAAAQAARIATELDAIKAAKQKAATEFAALQTQTEETAKQLAAAQQEEAAEKAKRTRLLEELASTYQTHIKLWLKQHNARKEELNTPALDDQAADALSALEIAEAAVLSTAWATMKVINATETNALSETMQADLLQARAEVKAAKAETKAAKAQAEAEAEAAKAQAEAEAKAAKAQAKAKAAKAEAEAEAEAARAEEEDRLRAEEEDRLRAEEEDRLRAEEEDRLRAEEEDRLRAEEEDRLRAEEEDRLRAEEEDRLRAEEEDRSRVDKESQRRKDAELYNVRKAVRALINAELAAFEWRLNNAPSEELVPQAFLNDIRSSNEALVNARAEAKRAGATDEEIETASALIWPPARSPSERKAALEKAAKDRAAAVEEVTEDVSQEQERVLDLAIQAKEQIEDNSNTLPALFQAAADTPTSLEKGFPGKAAKPFKTQYAKVAKQFGAAAGQFTAALKTLRESDDTNKADIRLNVLEYLVAFTAVLEALIRRSVMDTRIWKIEGVRFERQMKNRIGVLRALNISLEALLPVVIALVDGIMSVSALFIQHAEVLKIPDVNIKDMVRRMKALFELAVLPNLEASGGKISRVLKDKDKLRFTHNNSNLASAESEYALWEAALPGPYQLVEPALPLDLPEEPQTEGAPTQTLYTTHAATRHPALIAAYPAHAVALRRSVLPHAASAGIFDAWLNALVPSAAGFDWWSDRPLPTPGSSSTSVERLFLWRLDVRSVDINTGEPYDPERTAWGNSVWLDTVATNHTPNELALNAARIALRDSLRETPERPFYEHLQYVEEEANAEGRKLEVTALQRARRQLAQLGTSLSRRAAMHSGSADAALYHPPLSQLELRQLAIEYYEETAGTYPSEPNFQVFSEDEPWSPDLVDVEQEIAHCIVEQQQQGAANFEAGASCIAYRKLRHTLIQQRDDLIVLDAVVRYSRGLMPKQVDDFYRDDVFADNVSICDLYATAMRKGSSGSAEGGFFVAFNQKTGAMEVVVQEYRGFLTEAIYATAAPDPTDATPLKKKYTHQSHQRWRLEGVSNDSMSDASAEVSMDLAPLVAALQDRLPPYSEVEFRATQDPRILRIIIPNPPAPGPLQRLQLPRDAWPWYIRVATFAELGLERLLYCPTPAPLPGTHMQHGSRTKHNNDAAADYPDLMFVARAHYGRHKSQVDPALFVPRLVGIWIDTPRADGPEGPQYTRALQGESTTRFLGRLAELRGVLRKEITAEDKEVLRNRQRAIAELRGLYDATLVQGSTYVPLDDRVRPQTIYG